MAVSLKHTTQAVGTDAGNGEIRKAQWNEEHTLTAAANTVLGAVSAGAVGEITCTAAGRALIDDADAAAQRTTLGLGSAATLTAGTSANNLVQLDGSAKLPAVDGSLLTNLPVTPALPSGSVVPFAGTTEPSGWLFCFGQTVSRTTYSALFSAIGTTFGAGNGTTTFTLPDMRGRVIAGKDDMGSTAANRITSAGSGITGTTLGASGGAETHTLSTAQLASHSHNATLYNSGSGNQPRISATGSTTEVTTPVAVSSTGSGQAHNNMQPTIILNYIIKS